MPTLKMGTTTVLTDTTLANAVQDNITRLGTVASGVIGSAVVFPAGVVRSFAEVRNHPNLSLNTTYADVLGISITVTPKTTSSKFWIQVMSHIYMQSSNTSWQTCWQKIVVTPSGGSASIVVDDEDFGADAYGWGSQQSFDSMKYAPIAGLHSPNSTTAQTYKLMAKARHANTAGTMTLNRFQPGTMAVWEIG